MIEVIGTQGGGEGKEGSCTSASINVIAIANDALNDTIDNVLVTIAEAVVWH